MLERLENRFVFHKVYTGGGGGEKILGKNIPTQVCTYIISVSTYYVGSKDAGTIEILIISATGYPPLSITELCRPLSFD